MAGKQPLVRSDWGALQSICWDLDVVAPTDPLYGELSCFSLNLKCWRLGVFGDACVSKAARNVLRIDVYSVEMRTSKRVHLQRACINESRMKSCRFLHGKVLSQNKFVVWLGLAIRADM